MAEHLMALEPLSLPWLSPQADFVQFDEVLDVPSTNTVAASPA
ncbi:hypothetical protein [Nitrobacter sp.]|jgi:hypothetical protein